MFSRMYMAFINIAALPFNPKIPLCMTSVYSLFKALLFISSTLEFARNCSIANILEICWS